MSFTPAPFKRDALERIGTLLASDYDLRNGSSIPKQLFMDAAEAVGVSPRGTMPELGERIVTAAGMEWKREYDSRHTPSGGGVTVTRAGLNAVLEVLEIHRGSATAPAEAGFKSSVPYQPRAGGISALSSALNRNWDALDRATRAHWALEARIAHFVEFYGLEPLSPGNGQPAFDLAWMSEIGFVVMEIKSSNKSNHRQQMRLGVGQVLEYASLLEMDATLSRVIPVLVLADELSDVDHLVEDRSGVSILWGGNIERLIDLGLLQRPRSHSS